MDSTFQIPCKNHLTFRTNQADTICYLFDTSEVVLTLQKCLVSDLTTLVQRSKDSSLKIADNKFTDS